ncbi:tetratricopeptide repeat protein [Leptolyngbya sp. FACHB-36]|uniref:tetratricopeptide repeat protein n=1 Tax=Leptolyngbya sp. FACHB-36 TaxID=2692808 RepID=UPI0019AF691C|nr:tetratricopeptide repeat protein [Leptolyngbya sp. FACHB-36]MBD2022692.1 tetratricopeptide repeat protein [Leptolyngbya sp. FACHB-36]
MARTGCRSALGLVAALLLGAPAIAADLTQQFRAPATRTRSAARDDADRFLQLGKTQELDEFLEDAVQSWQQALQRYQDSGDREGETLVYGYLGSAYVRLGQLSAAEDSFRRQLAISRDRQDQQAQIYALNNLGSLLAHQGSVSTAAELFQQALTLAQQTRSHTGEALSQNSLGRLAMQSGDRAKALKHYQAALSASRLSDDTRVEATTLNNLGDGYRQNDAEALKAYELAVRLARLNRDRPNQLRAIDGMTAILSRQNRIQPAIDLVNERLDLTQEQENSREILTSLRSLAQLHQRLGNSVEAQQRYQDAIAIARSLNDLQQEQFLLTQLALIGRKSR